MKLKRSQIWLVALISILILLASGHVAAQSAGAVAQTTASAAASQVVSGPASDAASPVSTHNYVAAGGILVLFLVIASLIATRKLPALIALPLMAFGIGVIARIPLFGSDGILGSVLEGTVAPKSTGAFLLSKAIVYTLLGGMFARFISDAQIAERIIKYAAEFGGENPFLVSLTMSAITVLIFTAIGGLPAIIMLGTVMFPVLLSLGIPAATVGGMMLLAFPIGTSLAPTYWATSANQFNVDEALAQRYFLIWAAIQAVVLLAFLTIELLRMKRSPVTKRTVAVSIGVLVAFLIPIILICFAGQIGEALRGFAASRSGSAAMFVGATGEGFTRLAAIRDVTWPKILQILRWATWLLLGWAILQTQYEYYKRGRVTTYWNMLTPLTPLLFILLLGFGTAYVPAFLAALAFGYLTTPRPRALQRLSRAMMDGIGDVAAPVILMLGIGMLVSAATHPKVDAILTPLLAHVIPTRAVSYVVFFFLASPLALYRGPLNEWGLGVGVARLFSNFMPAAATMGAIKSVSMLQDPTTTQNVWICGFLKLDINALLFKLFFYSLTLVLAGLILSAVMFF